METIQPVIIEKNSELNPSLDFAVLRAQSIALLQKLSGTTWTDFNLHDPGITILEQLCYAITDLVYRTNFPIEDILSNLEGKIDTYENAFFSREEILTTNPVTVNDFRKVILDEVDEIANVQLEPVKSNYSFNYLKGLYKILIQVDPGTVRKFKDNPRLEEEVVNKVKRTFLNHRNLSEDMVRQIVVLKPRKVYISARVIIKEHLLPEELLANIYHQLEELLCPLTKRYTEKELLDQGMSIEQIYSGPLLKYGLIPDSELKPLKKEVDPAEILRAITEISGVLYVKDLSVNPEKDSPPGKPLVLAHDEFPLLEINFADPLIKLLSDEYEFEINEQIFKTIYNKYTEPGLVSRKTEARLPDRFITRGAYRNIRQYYSIQNYFPVTYGIGKEGLADTEPEIRKAQAKQLKAYLLFYEQVLADYLAQLAGMSGLFSTDLDTNLAAMYSSQSLYDVPGIEDILKPFTETLSIDKKAEWELFKNKDRNAYTQHIKAAKETTASYQARKNKLFDHLLARFNLRLSGYPVALYNSVYVNASEEDRNQTLLEWKANILKNTIMNTRNRVKSFNYADKEENTSGFEKKMLTLLHIVNKKNRFLSAPFVSQTVFYSPKKEKLLPKEEPVNTATHSDEDMLDSETFVSATEIRKLLLRDTYSWEPDKDTSYVFRDQTITLLKRGLEFKNYKIGPDPDNSNTHYLIIYKEPASKKWVTVSRHTSQTEASNALFKLIDYLKKLSTDCEGFHIVEHILLRPDIKNDVFGFRFQNKENVVAFANDGYSGFEEREAILARVMDYSNTELSTKPLKTISEDTQLKVKRNGINNFYYNLKVNELDKETSYPSETDYRNLVEGLKLFKEKKTKFFPRFQMTVKLTDQSIIDEDFFNFRMTVVLPSWPARFQDKEFRNFVKDLFMVNAPIYIRINILWLDVSAMTGFEKIYFQWLDAFQNNEPHPRLHLLSEQLIAMIKDDSFNII